MTISSAMTVTAVQAAHKAAPPVHSLKQPPAPGPASAPTRTEGTEIVPTLPVPMPPVVTSLTADFVAGRAAAKAARAAYQAARRQSQR